MAAAIALGVAVLALQHRLKSSHQINVATTERMKQREEYLNREMTRLLHEIERSAEETTLLSVSQCWLVWTIAGALVLLALVWWLHRKRIFPSDCCSEQESSSSKEENEKEEEDLKGLHSGVRSWATFTPSPMQGLPNKCKGMKELVGELLGVCQVLCKSSSMPQMYPATGMDDTCEAWNIQENSIGYQLLVFLRPPPGPSFHLELDATGQLPARPSNICVVLECVCWKKQLLRGTLCFLHHHEDKLPKDQSSVVLRTLCPSSYLDREKVACWAQLLLRSACLLLPESHHCQLTMLPSSQSCKFLLTSTADMTICPEIVFAVD